MAKNNVFAWSRSRSLPVAEGVTSGDPVVVGELVGVALTDRGAGGNADTEATVALDGAWTLPVTTTTTRAVGAPVYITSAGVLTPSATDNTLFGHCLKPKGSAAADVLIEIAQV